MRKGRESLWVIITLIAVFVAMTIVVLRADARATQYCVDQGYSAGECGWR